jgi:hypothetical protein
MKFKVVRDLRHEYEVEADNAEDALNLAEGHDTNVSEAGYSMFDHYEPTEDPPGEADRSILNVEASDPKVLRQRARDTEHKAAGTAVITDRVMRAGRTFARTYKGHSLTAVVLPGGRIKLGDGSVWKNLNQATQAAIELSTGERHSANAFQFWHDAEPAPVAKVETPTAEPAPTKARKGKAS